MAFKIWGRKKNQGREDPKTTWSADSPPTTGATKAKVEKVWGVTDQVKPDPADPSDGE